MRCVTIEDACRACERNKLVLLKAWKKAKRLPDLMEHFGYDRDVVEDRLGYYPHEIAARDGHLELLIWLVNNSGQQIDLTARENYAARLAASFGRLDILRWLVFGSGQKVDVTAKPYGFETSETQALVDAAYHGHFEVVEWLINGSRQDVDVTMNSNRAIQFAAYSGHQDIAHWLIFGSGQLVAILDVDSLQWQEPLPADLQQQLDSLREVSQRLRELDLSDRDRKVYLESPACRQAVQSGLITAAEQLATLLKTTAQLSEKAVRL